jgi:hypothetical protein
MTTRSRRRGSKYQSIYLNARLVEDVILGKFDVELDVEVAALVRIFINGHALLGYGTNAARREHLARGVTEHERAAVELLDHHLEAAQGLGDVYGVLHEEVVVIAREHLVLALLQHHYEISSLHSRLELDCIID